MSGETRDIAWDHPFPFIHEVRVEPQHIDDFQHTNNVVYLTWMAKTAWEHSKALGLDFAAYAKVNRGMVVRRHELEYLAASREGERVAIGTWITGNDGKLRLRRRFQMVNADTGVTLLRGLSDFVCINIETGRATRMPAEFAAAYALTATVPGDN
ncbi:MAG: acyl-CoA thioesterase [Parvibaculum sp.]|nr:acyl-CoA thioesterase [Parvibaculum sp.]